MLPIIETQRLILRPINKSDVYDMFEYSHRPNIGPLAGWAPHQSIEETKVVIDLMVSQGIRTGFGPFAITLKESGKMIGSIELFNIQQHFKCELGYSLNSDYWGQGIVVEAGKAVLKWAFEQLKMVRIMVCLFDFNHQSERVCQKLHMTYEGIAHQSYLRYDGMIFDCKVYAMTNEQYFALKEQHFYE